MLGTIHVSRDEDIVDAIRDAARIGGTLAVTGGGSKAGVGRPIETTMLNMTGITGVIDYDPSELVLTVRAGTPLAEVEQLLADERQMLAFEPFDHGPIYGMQPGAATVGGVIAAGVAGSRRVSAGNARDHVLGFRAVSGRGEIFVAGAKVVKNVTGYDLPKLLAGSWGRLSVLTELTLKVLPRPEARATRFVIGLDERQAVRAMATSMGSQAEVACASHRPPTHGMPAITAIRIEGFAPSVLARGAMLDRVLAPFGPVEQVGEEQAAGFWANLRTLVYLPADRPLWRVNVAPSRAAEIIEALASKEPAWLMDWAGGLIWIAIDDAADLVRAAASRADGHATLIRAPDPIREVVSALHPPPAGLAALETRVRRAFDPASIFETGRF